MPPATILASRAAYGSFISTRLGNVTWNEDGQCCYLTKRGITIVTPYLATSLPPPPILLNAEPETSNNPKSGHESDDEAGGDSQNVDEMSSYRSKLNTRRPEGGELRYWTSGITINEGQDGDRDLNYGWRYVGDEMNMTLNSDEPYPRECAWSPSGLSDLGGYQVSVYAPRGDQISKQWDEIADLTYETRQLLDPPPDSEAPITIEALKQLQATCLAWSPAVPHSQFFGLDASLLAIADRSGGVALWSYGSDKKFKRETYKTIVSSGWITGMSWGGWRVDDPENQVVAILAVTGSNGEVWAVPVTQGKYPEDDGSHKISVDMDRLSELLSFGDNRSIGCVKWIDKWLVWTKPGSIYINRDYLGLDDIQINFSRIGNWAGASALAPCVGIHLIGDDTLLVVLSTLSIHIIKDIFGNPTIADPEDHLTLSLSARHIFLDYAYGEFWKHNKFRVGTLDEKAITSHTCGWAGIGNEGIGAFYSQVAHFHNLDLALEGTKMSNFFITDFLKQIPGPKSPWLPKLEKVLLESSDLIRISPSKLLTPFLLRLVVEAPIDETNQELIRLCKGDTHDVNGVMNDQAQSPTFNLKQSLFGNTQINGSRLRYLLSLWCSRTIPSSRVAFSAAAESNRHSVRSTVLKIVLETMATQSPLVSPKTPDATFVKLIVETVTTTEVPGLDIPAIKAEFDQLIFGDTQIDACRACGEAVGLGDGGPAKCPKGHEWSRCSITELLITTPSYRICTSCTAIALQPRRLERPPIATTSKGEQRDHTRFVADTTSAEKGDRILQYVLEACVVCPTCGGRWMRAM